MSKLIKKHISLIKLFPHLNKTRQKLIIQKADDDLIDVISECCSNIERYLETPRKNKRDKTNFLKKYKKVSNYFSKVRKSYKKKKQVLKQSGSGFLNALFTGVLPLITKLFT